MSKLSDALRQPARDHKAGVGGYPLDLAKHVPRRDEANAMRVTRRVGRAAGCAASA